MDPDEVNTNTTNTTTPPANGTGLADLPPLDALDTAEDETFAPPPAPPKDDLPPLPSEPAPISHSGDESARTPESNSEQTQVTDSGQARMTKKRVNKKAIIGGIIALVLLIGVPLVALNIDRFRGDTRSKADNEQADGKKWNDMGDNGKAAYEKDQTDKAEKEAARRAEKKQQEAEADALAERIERTRVAAMREVATPTEVSIPMCGSDLDCQENTLSEGGICSSGTQVIYCCPFGKTINNGVCVLNPTPGCVWEINNSQWRCTGGATPLLEVETPTSMGAGGGGTGCRRYTLCATGYCQRRAAVIRPRGRRAQRFGVGRFASPELTGAGR